MPDQASGIAGQSGVVAIIGCGISGLATAIRLRTAGFQVQVFEQEAVPGGKVARLKQAGFQFDTGPTVLTQPWLLDELFELAGVQASSFLIYSRLPICCRYFFEEGPVINAWAEPNDFARELGSKTGEDSEAVLRYLREAEHCYRVLGSRFLDQPFPFSVGRDTMGFLSALLALRPAHLFQSLDRMNRKYFHTPEVIRIFNRFATYQGADPYRAPGILSMIAHLECNQGVYIAEGGMFKIVNALYNLATSLGVRFDFNTEVRKILLSGDKVIGLQTGDRSVRADAVVSNLDARKTYSSLLGLSDTQNPAAEGEWSSSAWVFCWGMNTCFQELDVHNIIFSKDEKAEFHSIFQLKQYYSDPTIHVHISSKVNPGLAPGGTENWYVMIHAPSGRPHPDPTEIRQMREQVLEKLERVLGRSVRQHILTEAVRSPADLEATTGAPGGALYGNSGNSFRSLRSRHAPRSRQYPGLYFVGGTVHPGGGIPLCLRGARMVSELIQRRHR